MNPYEVLGVAEDASFDKLRRRFRSLALQFHPDKTASGATRESKTEENGVEMSFQRIHAAWKMVETPEIRKETDERLSSFNRRDRGDLGRVGVEVDLDDLEYHPLGKSYEGSVLDEDTYVYTCRCGGQTIVRDSNLIRGECVFECPQCSQWFRVLYEEVDNDEQDEQDE